MSGRVTILDLGLGNLHSVARAFERASAAPELTSDPDVVRRADRLVVPGQGAIRQCSIALDGALGDALVERMRAGTPYLGICLGMQCLFDESEEALDVRGLGWFRGRVARFAGGMVGPDGRTLKVPHMGWNAVRGAHPFVEDGAYYYFVHSFRCVPADTSIVVGSTEYGGDFCSAVARDNVFACQFHPEKSHHAGARLLERFLAT